MASIVSSEFFLFAVTAGLFLSWQKKMSIASAVPGETSVSTTCASASSSGLLNSAFVFVKPHANTILTQALVRKTLVSKGLTIVEEGDISSQEIDQKKLIDQHYYAIASKATILPANEIPVPTDKFEAKFGEQWSTVLAEKRACNALEACERFHCTASELDAAWGSADTTKFGGGFYCGLMEMKGMKLYVFNGFFMSMRSKFVTPGTSIHYYVVEWLPTKLSWSIFRNQVLGPTDPVEGPVGSIRNMILQQYQALGLTSQPDKGDNGVHASASPFEGLAEKINWLGKSIRSESFGKALLAAGLAENTIKEWSVDPRITQLDGSQGSVFDSLEDMDVGECLNKLKELNEINSSDVI